MKLLNKFDTKKTKDIGAKIYKVGRLLMYSTMFAMLFEIDALATSSETVSVSLSGLQGIAESFVSSIGTIITLWGIFEWGNSMQSNDGMQQSSAIKRMGGGLIMCIAPKILASLI